MTPATVATASHSGGDERTLIASAAAGDRVAARALYDAHVAKVHRLTFRICGDEELANELTQDVFVKVFRQLAQFRGDSAFSTWVHRIVVNVSLNAMRKVRRLRERETDLDEAQFHEHEGSTIDHDLRARLAAAIESLPEGMRLALVMHAVEGYTHVEIGKALGIAEGTSKTRVFDARARLKVALADFREEA